MNSIAPAAVIFAHVFGFLRFLFSGCMLKIIILLVIVGALYWFGIWPFNKNVVSMSYLENKYCDNQNAQKRVVCDCIVLRLKSDLASRFTIAELDSMQEDKLKTAYIFEKSLQKIEPEAKACLQEAGHPGAWDDFRADLASQDNEYLKKAGSAIKSGADYLKEKWNARTEEKKDIDKRY